MIYVLIYPDFNAPDAARINAFRARHEAERAKLVPPHVTLVFGVGEGHLPTVSALIDMVARRTKAFPVVFDASEIEFDPFEKTHKLFLLCGAGRERIAALHSQLYEGEHSAELSAAHPFKPHMTVATYEQRQELERVDPSTIGPLPISATVSALQLVQLRDGQLSTLKTVAFKA